MTSRGDAGFERVRRGLSASRVIPDDRPACVVSARSVAEVVDALTYAASHGRQVSIRSGGHSLSFASLREGMLALDVSSLDAVRIDAAAGTAVVGPGVTSLQMAEALRGSGWAFPVGHKTEVALGGFLLAGGNGWNQGEWGSATGSVTAADVVLADRRILRLSRDSDPLAFAALRGAGLAFPGVVTAFHLRLWPEPDIHRRLATLPIERVPQAAVLAELGSAFGCRHRRRTLRPGGDAARPDASGHTRDGVTAGLDVLLIRRCAAAPGPAVDEAPSPHSSILVSSSSYRRSEPPNRDTAYYPLGTITAAAYASWEPGERDAANETWPVSAIARMSEHWSGHYVGEVDLRRTPELLNRCFRPEVLSAIDAVRARLDPAARFADYPERGLSRRTRTQGAVLPSSKLRR